MKKILIVGIIILFIGLAFIPSFNAVSNSNKVYVCNSGSPPIANFSIEYVSERGYVIFDGTSSYDIDGEIVLYEWEYGDGNIFNCSFGWGFNQYCDEGKYNVTLNVIDDEGLTGNLTKYVFIELANTPPPFMDIRGQESGNAGTEYEYIFSIICGYSAMFFFLVDWGDGNTTDWIGHYDPFENVYLSHTWSKEGEYTIRAIAKDLCREGDWAEFTVTMPRDKSTSSSPLLRFLERYPLLIQFIQRLSFL